MQVHPYFHWLGWNSNRMKVSKKVHQYYSIENHGYFIICKEIYQSCKRNQTSKQTTLIGSTYNVCKDLKSIDLCNNLQEKCVIYMIL